MNHSQLLIQLVVILATARCFGWLLRYVGQTSVIGEMSAGLILGPIVFGQLAPEWQASIFAPGSLLALEGIAELGIVLFMFIVGAELRMPSGARKQLTAATSVSTLSVVVPLAGGLGVAYVLYSDFAPTGVEFWPFALFVAAALAVTAFPVLARIIKERKIYDTEVGRLSLTSAAFIDVVAWILLALVVALLRAQHDWTQFLIVVAGIVALALLVFGVVRPLLTRVMKKYSDADLPQGALIAPLLIGAFGCAFLTNELGIHSVFGAFLFGVCLPRDDRLVAVLIERIEHIAVLVLMPIFFALAGLRATPDAFADGGVGALLLVLAVAVFGKLIGGALGARMSGQPWRESCAVGALMNARGMMELVFIKVGLDMGVIEERLFTMLLIMALITTFMTGPLLSAVLRGRRSRGVVHAD